MARLPPSRHPLHCGLRIPDLRARDDSPLNRSCHQGVPAICLMRRLPAQSIRRCGLNATFRTRLQQCDGDWWPLSPRCYRVAHAARLGTDTEICDTVRLARPALQFDKISPKQETASLQTCSRSLTNFARTAWSHYYCGRRLISYSILRELVADGWKKEGAAQRLTSAGSS